MYSPLKTPSWPFCRQELREMLWKMEKKFASAAHQGATQKGKIGQEVDLHDEVPLPIIRDAWWPLPSSGSRGRALGHLHHGLDPCPAHHSHCLHRWCLPGLSPQWDQSQPGPDLQLSTREWCSGNETFILRLTSSVFICSFCDLLWAKLSAVSVTLKRMARMTHQRDSTEDSYSFVPAEARPGSRDGYLW